MCRAAAILVCGAALALTVPGARADYAVLASGERLHITGLERIGDTVRLDLPGGSVTVSAEQLARVEREEIFPVTPAPVIAGPYADQIRAAASAYALDPALIESVIKVESNFNARAISRKNAQGLMQLLPETATRFSVRNAFDPDQNINAGARYLRELLDRYEQNLTLALAAYNAGPDNVDQYRGVPPFRETRSYVARVTERLHQHETADSRAVASIATQQKRPSPSGISKN